MSEMVRLEVQVYPEFLRDIDHWIKRGGYVDREEFLGAALRSQVREHEDLEFRVKGKVIYRGAKNIEIPKPIIERIQKIIDFKTCGYDNIQEYIEAALIKDIESITDLLEIPDK